MEGQAVRGAAADARQACQLRDEILDSRGKHGFRLVVVSATADGDAEPEVRRSPVSR
jgi:hypothetical protein